MPKKIDSINDFRNVVIFMLSVIILGQSVLLMCFMRRPKGGVSEKADGEIVFESAQRQEQKKDEQRKPLPERDVSGEAAGRIALVLDDWGYNLRHVDFVTGNDYHLTISILPFKRYSGRIADLAHSAHKDVIVHVSMEPEESSSCGLEENTLLSSMNDAAILRLLESAFTEVSYAAGMSNHMGSKATQDPRLMRTVFSYLEGRDFFFLDSLVTPKSVSQALGKTSGVAVLRRDIFIDNESDRGYIRGQILKLAEEAKRSGVAVGIGHDRPMTISVLKEMIPKLMRQGYEFVNLSEVLSSDQEGD